MIDEEYGRSDPLSIRVKEKNLFPQEYRIMSHWILNAPCQDTCRYVIKYSLASSYRRPFNFS